jgi:hypothetical protein
VIGLSLGWVSIARAWRAQLSVRRKLVRLFTVFVYTEIPLPRDKKPLRFCSTRAKFERGTMVSTMRGKAMNIFDTFLV